VTTALYRRYRPENFAELIGQTHVTLPLMAALRGDRVNHAYLFSGPRGCGKTTSARILARCLNCAEGPTDTPCGKCPSCIELSRDGGGSLDVVEIDAASHNGVDDARELRERAIFAPARDRYKIFILDEAHMVTAQGFNALLKLVEEPPAHVKFIFATTEPEKVIPTIRSRTHHYPFRLVPPAQMLEYLEQLCESEKVAVEPGVLALVVRSGEGSVRDSLSLLDQLIAGSEDAKVTYERAVSLLGYTHESLLDEVVDAFAISDSAGVFKVIDSVIQSGQDPRRFVEDLLERLRDLIVIQSVGPDAGKVLRGVSVELLEKMSIQASRFGSTELTHAAAAVNAALGTMTGATSPKLLLELMAAKVLVPASDATEIGSLTRIERLERRIGIGESGAGGVNLTQAIPVVTPAVAAPATPAAPASAPVTPAQTSKPAAEPAVPVSNPAPATAPIPAVATSSIPLAPITTQQVKDAWGEILTMVDRESKAAWVVAFTLQVVDLTEDVLTLRFKNQYDLDTFKNSDGAPDVLRRAIFDVLGIRVKFKPHMAEATPTTPIAVLTPVAEPVAPVSEPAEPATALVAEPALAEPEVVAVEESADEPSEEPVEAAAATQPIAVVEEKPAAKTPPRPRKGNVDEDARVGESLLRELLGAEPMDDGKPAGGR